MITLTHSEYCKNKTIRMAMGWMNGFYTYKGNLYTAQQRDELYPIDLPLVNILDKTTGKGANANTSQNFINGVKSY